MATRPRRAPHTANGSQLEGHFIVCGLDELGFRAAEELHRLGEVVVVINPQETNPYQGLVQAMGVQVIHASYREEEALRRAGILTARALIITGNDDVGNIHAALLAHEVRPRLRVVVRMFNPELGESIASLLHDCKVLSSSSIAAPAFVEAAVQEQFEQRLEVGGKVLVLRRARPDEPDVLLAVAATDTGGAVVIFPEGAGEALCLVDTGEVASAFHPRPSSRPRRRRWPAGLIATRDLLGTLADSRVRYVLAVVAALTVVSMLILHYAAGLSFLDAVYFTVTTITTIGYGDITLINSPLPARLYGIALELVGAGVIAMFFAVITDTLVGDRLRQALGGLHRDMEDHIVVCGLGNIGHRVAEQVHRMHIPVAAMEAVEAQKAVFSVRRAGVPVLIGDAREMTNLQKLEVGRARCLIACTDDDITNLEIALNARAINRDLKIVIHLHDPDLAVRVQNAIGLGVSRSAAGLAAPAFVSAALGHRVISTLPLGNRSLVVAHALVGADSDAVGQNVGWLLDGPYARVLALHRRPGQIWRPGSEVKLEAGDDLVLVSTRKGLDEVLRRTEARPTVSTPATA